MADFSTILQQAYQQTANKMAGMNPFALFQQSQQGSSQQQETQQPQAQQQEAQQPQITEPGYSIKPNWLYQSAYNMGLLNPNEIEQIDDAGGQIKLKNGNKTGFGELDEKDITEEKPGVFSSPSRSQRDMFVDAMQDQAIRDYYSQYDSDIYGDLTGDYGYEAFRDIGNNADYSYKHDLVRDLFGFNEDNPAVGIQGWRYMLPASGIDMSQDDEAIIQAIMDYMWSPENVTNISSYLNDTGYDYTKHNLGSGSTADSMADYITRNYMLDDADSIEAFASLFPNADEKDVASWLSATNRLASGQKAKDSDLDAVQSLIASMGGAGKYSLSDDMSGDSLWTDANMGLTPADLSNAIAQYASGTGELPNMTNDNINGGTSAYFSALIPALAAWVESGTGKRVTKE